MQHQPEHHDDQPGHEIRNFLPSPRSPLFLATFHLFSPPTVAPTSVTPCMCAGKMLRACLCLSVCITAAAVTTIITFDGRTVTVVSPTYLSLNIDTGSLYQNIDLTDRRLSRLLGNLASYAPLQLRIGGGAADNAAFTGVGGRRGNCSLPTLDPSIDICVDSTYWRDICDFATRSNVNLVWDLNVALRRSDTGAWNSSNTEALFRFTSGMQAACPVAAWQLGNEVEDFYKRHPVLNISGSELAADYRSLRQLLASYPSLSQRIMGPDACCEERLAPPIGQWLTNFTAGTAGALDAVTVHHYPLPVTCDPASFTNKTAYLSLNVALAQYAAWAAPAVSRGVPLVLGEVATAAHGGCANYSNTFVSGFTWMYELGAVAEAGFTQLNRQDFVGFSSETEPSQYALVGHGWSHGPLSNPHPDYFTSVLWKQLVGSRVLRSNYAAPNASEWDSHVWCGREAGTLVISYFSMSSAPIEIRLPQLGNAYIAPRSEFWLTSTATAASRMHGPYVGRPSTLTDDAMYLNGELMTLNADGSLPVAPIPGRVVSNATEPIVAPPWSYGFVLFFDVGREVQACWA